MMKDKAGTSKHRRMMTPLAAILLCAVAMIGLGQAMLMPTVENSANTVNEIDALSIDLYTDSNGSSVYTDSAFSGADITFVKKHSAGDGVSKYFYAIDSNGTVQMNENPVYLGIKGDSTGTCTVDVTVSVAGGDKINPFDSFELSYEGGTAILKKATNTYSGSFDITKSGTDDIVQEIDLTGNISAMSNVWTSCDESFDPVVGELTVEFTIKNVQ